MLMRKTMRREQKGSKGMFCKSSARVAFVVLWRENEEVFPIRRRERKERFSEKEHKKEILFSLFLI